jgi:hypothetical protein
MLSLALALCCQLNIPTPLPQYDPAGYQLRYAGHGYVVGPFAPPVGNPRVINLYPIGEVVATNPAAQTFDVQYPGDKEVVRFHYTKRTAFRNPGKLEVGRWVHVDRQNNSVNF